MQPKETHEQLNEMQRLHHDAAADVAQRAAALDKEERTIDRWCHKRVLSTLDPLLQAYPGATWLTVGDGKFGADAHYLKTKGATATASDIADACLIEAKKVGYVDDFARENAEAMSFDNRSFDFVMCKEAYHHFPRPPLALYEMLRVARVGVALIEPNDPVVTYGPAESLLLPLRWVLRALLRKPLNTFEESGNYVFSISRREMEKVALGLGLPAVAFIGVNDEHNPALRDDEATPDSPKLAKVRRKIALKNLLSSIGLRQHMSLAAFLFKEAPTPEAVAALQRAGVRVVELPKNPYLPASSS